MRNTGPEGAARRGFLRLCAGLAALAGGLAPALGLAQQETPEPELESAAYREALTAALRGRNWIASDGVTLDLPQLAENGAIVPVTVESRLPGTRRILLFAEKNPGPLLAQFHFEPGTDAWVSLRLKLNETGPVLAIAESAGQFFGVRKTVRVMVGGCG